MTWDKGVNIFSLSKGKGIKNHFLTSLPANLLTSKAAFTLAEVLITLGIIGIVAAMTIPGLINNYKAQRLHSKFLKTYSVLQQVFKQMEADDVSLDPNSYPYLQPFYTTYMKYLTNITNCGRLGVGAIDIRTAPCYYTRAYKYRDYSGKSTINEYLLDDGQIVLADGTIIFFENAGSKIWLSVDLNGLDVPNRWGVDLFTFQFLDGELRTMGSPGTTYTDMNNYCNINVSHNLNGIACAHKAKSNSDYFKQAVKLK